jgi:hypothetical protein
MACGKTGIESTQRGVAFTPSGVKSISPDPVWGLLARRLEATGYRQIVIVGLGSTCRRAGFGLRACAAR